MISAALRRLVVVALNFVPRTTPLVAPRPRARCGAALGAGRAPPPDLANCVGVGEFNAALRARARSRDVAGTARAWAALVEHCAPNDRSYGILIDGHARVGDADAALAALAAVPGGGNVVHHASCMQALSRAGRDAEAAALHERMVAGEGARPNQRSYHGYLRALGALSRAGDDDDAPRKAAAALDELRRSVGVDARAYQTAVYVCREAKDWARLLAIFEAHARDGDVAAPDGLARTAALQACRPLGDDAAAKRVWDAWQADLAAGRTRDAPDAFAFSAFAAARAPSGAVDLAFARALLADARRAGALPPADSSRAAVAASSTREVDAMSGLYASLLEGLAARGRVGDAVSLLGECEDCGLAGAAAYDAAAAAAAVAGDADAAIAVLRRSGGASTRRGWDAALRACAAATPPRPGAASALLEEMGGRAGRRSFRAALAAADRGADGAAAARVHAAAHRAGLADGALLAGYVRALRRAADAAAPGLGAPRGRACAEAARAPRALLDALGAAETVPDAAFRDAVLAARFGGGTAARDARAVLDAAQARGVDVGQAAADAVAAALAAAGDWRGAAAVAEGRRRRGLVPPSAATQTLVVRAAERAGEWRAALRLMEDMRKDDVTFYDNPIFDSLFKTGVMVWNAGAGVEVHGEEEGGGG